MKPSIQELVGRLENLHEIFRVQGEILLCGEEAVEPLTRLLLSPPSTFPEPRVAAAECLGAIGNEKAIDALLQVLSHNDVQGVGSVQRLAEETVRNAAARQLGRFPHLRICDALLNSLQQDHLIGAGIALAQLRDARAIPYLVECLEDDVKKGKAMEAIQQFGCAAIPDLEDALQRPRFVNGMEPPLSQERRARAAELLGQLRAHDVLPALESRLHDSSAQVRVACALAMAEFEGAASENILPHLIAGLEEPDFLCRNHCEKVLAKLGKASVRLLAHAAAGLSFRAGPGGEVGLSPRGRTSAIKLLGTIEQSEAIPSLIRLLDDPEAMVRVSAAAALSHFSEQQSIDALLKAALVDSSKAVRSTARAALRRKGKMHSLRKRVLYVGYTVCGTVSRFLHRH